MNLQPRLAAISIDRLVVSSCLSCVAAGCLQAFLPACAFAGKSKLVITWVAEQVRICAGFLAICGGNETSYSPCPYLILSGKCRVISALALALGMAVSPVVTRPRVSSVPPPPPPPPSPAGNVTSFPPCIDGASSATWDDAKSAFADIGVELSSIFCATKSWDAAEIGWDSGDRGSKVQALAKLVIESKFPWCVLAWLKCCAAPSHHFGIDLSVVRSFVGRRCLSGLLGHACAVRSGQQK